MKKCKGEAQTDSLNLANMKGLSFEELINANREIFTDYLHKLGVFVDATSTTYHYKNLSRTELTFKTECFKVDFNENFVIITPLK